MDASKFKADPDYPNRVLTHYAKRVVEIEEFRTQVEEERPDLIGVLDEYTTVIVKDTALMNGLIRLCAMVKTGRITLDEWRYQSETIQRQHAIYTTRCDDIAHFITLAFRAETVGVA